MSDHREADIRNGIIELINESHATACDKGWWESVKGQPDRNFPEQLMLMVSELSEVLEAYREVGLTPSEFLFEVNSHGFRVGMRCGPDPDDIVKGPGKPEGIAAEFADVLIRIADTCGRYGIPLAKAVISKLAYNKTRPYRHGGKKA